MPNHLQKGNVAIVKRGPARFRGHLVIITGEIRSRAGIDANGLPARAIGYEARDYDSGETWILPPETVAHAPPEALEWREIDRLFATTNPNDVSDWAACPWQPVAMRGAASLTAIIRKGRRLLGKS